jgi:EAL domain-containing protein (putative c-di-GMP-specific phosphodiesterase class I)
MRTLRIGSTPERARGRARTASPATRLSTPVMDALPPSAWPQPGAGAAGPLRAARTVRPAPEGLLVAVYQPVLHLDTGRVVAAEALSRFLGSERTPEQWFAEAVRDGSAATLELAAARAALRGLDALPRTVRLALNFSPGALVDPAVAALLMPYARRLIIEVTEHAPVHDFDRLREALRPLRTAGAWLAADDIGTGYANVDQVSRLLPDILKIDKAMVRGLVDDHVCRAFVAAVADFAANVGVRVVAEGVETPEELDQLRRLGVRHAQGYLLGRPGTPSDVVAVADRASSRTRAQAASVPKID